MANLHLYVSSCALLLLLSLTLRPSSGLPVPPTLTAERCGRCGGLFRGLLDHVTELIKSERLCYGIKSDKMAMKSSADTVQACAPNVTQDSGCMMQRNSSFSESQCLMNIMKDLAHHHAAITSFLQSHFSSPAEERQFSALLTPTLEIIRRLRTTCSLVPSVGSDLSEGDAAQPWGSNTFDNRLEMCKMMRGFHVRVITINRAMSYIREQLN